MGRQLRDASSMFIALGMAIPVLAQPCPPGFEFNNDVTITGEVRETILVWPTSLLSCGDLRGPDYFDATPILDECGPNTLSNEISFENIYCLIGGGFEGGTDVGYASAAFEVEYALVANAGVITFTTAATGVYAAGYERMGAPWTNAPLNRSAGFLNAPLTVELPVTVNTAGTVTVGSVLTVDECDGTDGDIAVTAYWRLEGDKFVIQDFCSLTDCGSDSWEGTNTFEIEPGDYVLSVTYSSISGINADCNTDTNQTCEVDNVYAAHDRFELELFFTCGGFIRCDANCDNHVDFFDIEPFVQAIIDPAAYGSAHPSCSLYCNSDISGDGLVNFFDIDHFLECIE